MQTLGMLVLELTHVSPVDNCCIEFTSCITITLVLKLLAHIYKVNNLLIQS